MKRKAPNQYMRNAADARLLRRLAAEIEQMRREMCGLVGTDPDAVPKRIKGKAKK